MEWIAVLLVVGVVYWFRAPILAWIKGGSN